MLDIIPSTHRIFINTTIPVMKNYTADEVVAFLNRNKDKITCVNVSRHIFKYVEEGDDDIFDRIEVKKRINCVLYGKYTREKVIEFIKRFQAHGLPIQFRYDYTTTTPENLYDEGADDIFAMLCSIVPCTFAEGCRIRCNYEFGDGNPVISYHRTLPYSTMTVEKDGVEYDVLYDIIIKQNGDIHSDWTGVMLDVDKYRDVVYEPYDLHTFTPGQH